MTELSPHIPDTASCRVPPVLLPYQQRWVADVSPLRVVEKNRRTDIAWTEVPNNVLTAALSASVGGVNVYYIAYSQDMAVEYIQACAMWIRAFNYVVSEIGEGSWERDDDDRHIRTCTIKFPDSGFRIVTLSSRPSSLHGRQGIIVINEATLHEQLDELLRAALAMLIWGRKVRVIFTHDSNGSPFNTLIGGIRTGCQGGSIHHITFQETISEGLFRRACLHTRKEWSEASEQAQVALVYKSYGAGVFEEFDCVPASGGGAWLSRALTESRMSVGMPVLRLIHKEGYKLLSDEIHFHEIRGWLDEHLGPLLEALLVSTRSFLGRDFSRSEDLSVDYPLLQEKSLIRRVLFVLELRNVPFRQQEQITWYLMDGLPGLLGATFDVRGNGAYLAEYAIQRHDSGRVQQVTPTEDWYREHMPPIKAALEDGSLVDLPKDEDALDDLRAAQVMNDVPRVPEQCSRAKADGDKCHGDSAIVLAPTYSTSHEINEGPVKASSCRRRQAAHMLEGF